MTAETIAELNIRKLSHWRFLLEYPDLDGFRLVVNFEPLAAAAGLLDNFCLLHWQAKPFGRRKWGIFCHEKGETRYISPVEYECSLPIRTMQVDETIITSVPTAALVVRDAKLRLEGQTWKISSVS